MSMHIGERFSLSIKGTLSTKNKVKEETQNPLAIGIFLVTQICMDTYLNTFLQFSINLAIRMVGFWLRTLCDTI